MTATTSKNHQLKGNGAPFTAQGERVHEDKKVTSGVGRAMCSCGWLSLEVATGADRRRAFKDHRASAEYRAFKDHQASAEYLDAQEELDLENLMEDLYPNGIPDPDVADLLEELVDLEHTVTVAWPEDIAKLFFGPMARNGAFAFETVGLSVLTDAKARTVDVVGTDPVRVGDVARWLPTTWKAANRHLAAWRKASEIYKAEGLTTKEGRSNSWALERAYLDGWFIGVDDLVHSTKHVLQHDEPARQQGHREALAWYRGLQKTAQETNTALRLVAPEA